MSQPPVPAGSPRLPGYALVMSWARLDGPGGGGVSEVVQSLAIQLRTRQAYDPFVLIGTWDREPDPAPYRDGIEGVNLRMRAPVVDHMILRRLLTFARVLPADLWALAALVRKRRIEVINAHYPSLHMYVVWLARCFGLYRGKIILSFHGGDLTAISQLPALGRLAWRILLSRVDRVVACSNDLARRLSQIAPAARVEAIPNGMDVEIFRRQPRTGLQRRRILNVGKYERRKGQDVLLEAFELLLKSVPDASLTLVGVESPGLPAIREWIADHGLNSRVDLHVNVPHTQVPDFMDHADIFVLPSREEAFGIVLLEAGAAGLPVVASRAGGIPELIEDGVTGLLVPIGDSTQLEQALRSLMTDSAAADRMALAWHERSLANWNWDRTCSRYLEIVGHSPEQSPAAR
jgi:glycosyltransferase involved in cell wall biosynthesis